MLFGLIGVIVIMFLFWYSVKESATKPVSIPSPWVNQDLLPATRNGELLAQPCFIVSYVEKYELPEWVAYELTIDRLNASKNERNQMFSPDPAIKSKSGHPEDYRGSGYRRGHLVPSADMAWNKDAMDATFLMSNVAPMKEEFNDVIWLELEHNVRDWGRKHKKIVVITGPVFSDTMHTIGKNEIYVPTTFYKAVFTSNNQKPHVVGFLINQTDTSFGPLEQYVVPVDSIERVTGLDLFSNLYGSWDKEIELESASVYDQAFWPFNEKWKRD